MEVNPFLKLTCSVNRRRFLATSAVAAGAAVLGVSEPARACTSADDRPTPIPPNPALGGLSLQIPPKGKGDEPATVYNFHGMIGRALAQGMGTSSAGPLFWAADLGFAQGKYVSTAGETLRGGFFFC